MLLHGKSWKLNIYQKSYHPGWKIFKIKDFRFLVFPIGWMLFLFEPLKKFDIRSLKVKKNRFSSQNFMQIAQNTSILAQNNYFDQIRLLCLRWLLKQKFLFNDFCILFRRVMLFCGQDFPKNFFFLISSTILPMKQQTCY